MLFDTYICVDWSAAATPRTGRDSIWIGIQSRQNDGHSTYRALNPATRLAARKILSNIIAAQIAHSRRVLVGFDFALGYPAGTAQALGLNRHAHAPWQAMQACLHSTVEDTDSNRNNRFAVAAEMNRRISGRAHPFWGTPTAHAGAFLSTKKGDFTRAGELAETRRAEAWIKSDFRARPKSVWQLLGVGAVGSQSLMGIPTLYALRQDFPTSRIWPFELGLRALTSKRLAATPCVFAEVYPSTVGVAPQLGEVHDAAQIRSLCNQFFSLDEDNTLGEIFAAHTRLSDMDIYQIETEEGWILAKKP